MFEGMGIQWACTLLGFVALILVPVPVYFLLRGKQLRQKSAYAPTFPAPPPKPAVAKEEV
jgi:MFS transporter, DHA1 family, multidrug resistance protein